MPKTKKTIEAVDVYLQKRKTREYAGRLSRTANGFTFRYDDKYVYGQKAIPLGPDLPLSVSPHTSRSLFPSFEDRIPSKKNPAYAEYCKNMGISPSEKDPLVLVATIGQKGPSSFVFTPVIDNQFSPEDVIDFRKELNLSIREFADIFDISFATIHRIEIGKTSGKDTLKRIEIYRNFPEVAKFEIERNGFKINDEKRIYTMQIIDTKMKNLISNKVSHV